MSKIQPSQTGKIKAPEEQGFFGKMFGRTVEASTGGKPRTSDIGIASHQSTSSQEEIASRGPIIEDLDLSESPTNKMEVEFKKNIEILTEFTGEKIEAIKNTTIELLGVLAKKFSDYTVLLLECIGHTIEVIADAIKVAGYNDFNSGINTIKAYAAYDVLTAPPNTGSDSKDLIKNLQSLETYVSILSYLPITETNLPFIRRIAKFLTEPKLIEKFSKIGSDVGGSLAVLNMLNNIQGLLNKEDDKQLIADLSTAHKKISGKNII